MSPLARSLLAFASLLVVAHGNQVAYLYDPPGSLCTGLGIVIIDQKFANQMDLSFHFESRGDEELHEIVDHCKQLGYMIAKQTVRACNGYKLPDGAHWFPPELRAVGDGSVSQVYASCKGNPQCKPIKFHVNQTCV